MVRYGGTFSLRSTQSKKEKEKRTLCAALNSPFQSRHGILLLVGSFPFSFFSFHNADTWDTIFNCNSQTDGAIKTRAKKKKKEVASKAHTFFFFFFQFYFFFVLLLESASPLVNTKLDCCYFLPLNKCHCCRGMAIGVNNSLDQHMTHTGRWSWRLIGTVPCCCPSVAPGNDDDNDGTSSSSLPSQVSCIRW